MVGRDRIRMSDRPKKKLYHQGKDPLLPVKDVTDMINAYKRKKREQEK